jgi:hypothetical protein
MPEGEAPICPNLEDEEERSVSGWGYAPVIFVDDVFESDVHRLFVALTESTDHMNAMILDVSRALSLS